MNKLLNNTNILRKYKNIFEHIAQNANMLLKNTNILLEYTNILLKNGIWNSRIKNSC